MSDISQLGEDGIISLFANVDTRDPVIKGIGDDCAVLRLNENELLLWTTDLLVEDVHFKRDVGTPKQLGMKSLAVNLSDIAAMGGTPTACLLALSLPKDLDQIWVNDFRDGFMEMASRFRCQLVGGDTCRSTDRITISVSVVGKVLSNEVIWRTGARDGDDIWVSGIPGYSELGLRVLKDGGEHLVAVVHHLCPEPQCELGRRLAESSAATSCIDTSDGLAVDLTRICELNNLGAVLEESLIPSLFIPEQRDDDPLELALYGGEDYGLLFTAKPDQRTKLKDLTDLHRIGRMDSSITGIMLSRADGTNEPIQPYGRSFSHF